MEETNTEFTLEDIPLLSAAVFFILTVILLIINCNMKNTIEGVVTQKYFQAGNGKGNCPV